VPLSTETGEFLGPVQNMYDPKAGRKVVAAGRCNGGVNHSNNDDSTIRMRQADPHSHALVLDPYVGCVAYVPDLGKDLIREFYYDREVGKIEMELNAMPSGLCTGHPDGPRYLSFHPRYNIAYVVNELSSTIAVFEVDKKYLQQMSAAAQHGDDMTQYKGRSSLRLVQSIKTIPCAFPTLMNTCGRICVHKSGSFVVVSNRGHQSIGIFRVITKGGPRRGELVSVGYFHTRGETPRHFQFDSSGQYLLVANQDSDSIAVFNFNLSSGLITYTGNEYRVPSPNFVCCCPMRGFDDEDDVDDMIPSAKALRVSTSTIEVSNLDFLDRKISTISNDDPVANSSNQADGDIGSLESSGESTTVPTGTGTNTTAAIVKGGGLSKNSEYELELAHKEIAQLKQQLMLLSSSSNCKESRHEKEIDI
jgi:6-phosphogluconolactonase